MMFWVLGLFLVALMQMSVYPSVKKSAPQLSKYVESMPEAMKAMVGLEKGDYTSPAGYLNTELFSMILPVVFAAFAMGAGSKAVAGEEDRRTLDMLLSTPIPRKSVVVQKFAAMVLDIGILVIALFLGLWLGGLTVSFDIGAGFLLAACVNCGLLGLVMGCTALLIGSWRGGRGLALGITSALLVGLFLLRSLAEVLDGLRPFQKLSPFYWYSRGDVLRNGLDLADAAVLLGASLILALLALAAFEGRDLHA